MNFDLRALPPRDRYRLLTGAVVPRPIALVTSLDAAGRVNAAPFSFFNVVGSDPATVVLGPGETKHTLRNLRDTGEFVVNLVSEDIAEAMNVTAADFPDGVSELEAAGLTAAPARQVAPPRVLESPVNLECRVVTILEIGRNRLVVAEVLEMAIRDDLVDAERLRVRSAELRLIGRMGGLGGYARTRDAFEIARLSHADWLERGG